MVQTSRPCERYWTRKGRFWMSGNRNSTSILHLGGLWRSRCHRERWVSEKIVNCVIDRCNADTTKSNKWGIFHSISCRKNVTSGICNIRCWTLWLFCSLPSFLLFDCNYDVMYEEVVFNADKQVIAGMILSRSNKQITQTIMYQRNEMGILSLNKFFQVENWKGYWPPDCLQVEERRWRKIYLYCWEQCW